MVVAERRSASRPVTPNADKPAAWRRWLSIALRAVHLASVVGIGAVLLGAPLPLLLAGATVLCSGIALLALEIADARMRWNELAGLVSLAKLAVIAWMALDPALRSEPVLGRAVRLGRQLACASPLAALAARTRAAGRANGSGEVARLHAFARAERRRELVQLDHGRPLPPCVVFVVSRAAARCSSAAQPG